MRYKVTTPPTNYPEARDSRLSLYNKRHDKNLFNSIDAENIKLSGSKVLVYKYTPSEEYDEVYMESRQKPIASEPVVLWSHYDPRPIEEELSEFGVEIQYDQTFIFNKSQTEQLLGRPIISGDIIEPEFQSAKFEVFEVQEDEFQSYGVYHLLVSAKVLRDTEDIRNEEILDRGPRVGGKL